MRKYHQIFFLIIIFAPGTVFSDNLYSIATGNWSSTTIWSYTPGGTSCGCSPIASDNVTISGDTVYMDKHLTNVGSSLNGITGVLTIDLGAALLGGSTYNIDIRSTGTLNLCGTLTAEDVVFSNGSVVNVCLSGALTVNGDFFNKNNSNTVVIDGSMTVNGDYENGNGGVISGIGTIAITSGSVTNTGSTYGCEGYDPCFGVYPCTVTSPCVSPLPVVFLSVTAYWKPDGVEVNWSTASEINNDHFDVLRSPDGTQFQPVGTVGGAGTTSRPHDYLFTDREVPPLVNMLYYRIRQVDYDGRQTLSNIAAVKRSEASVTVFPNPVIRSGQKDLTIGLHNTGPASITLTDARGRRVRKASSDAALSSVIRLPVRNLAAGVYFLKVQSANVPVTYKVVVSN
jgi:hypothetical protein